MCIIYDEGKRLPQDKHDLYDRIIDTVLHGRYRDPVAKDAARNRLGVIALGMHTGESLGEARTTPQAEATYAEIERMLKIYQDRSPWTEEGYLGAVETREDLLSNSGLLLSSGEKRAQFYHFSFQEFLAAQRILDLTDRSLLDVFRERAAAPEWRNTLSLLFGRVLGTRVSPEKGITLMQDMIDAISLEAVGLQLVVAEARLGDPRFHVDAWYLPDEPLLGFVEIPEGPFLMGSKKGDLRVRKNELDQHPVTLPRYYIARYPVTVAQFQAFVQDSSDQPQR
jgi:Sulfatase-modifying factor enzyme 1